MIFVRMIKHRLQEYGITTQRSTTAQAMHRNVIWNIAEVALTALTQFLIFKLIIARLNLSSLGVWSLVLSALSFARIADVGMASGLVRYIARPRTEGADRIPPLIYAETALLTNFGLYLVIGIIIYPLAHFALGLALHGSPLLEARALLPYGVASFILLNLSAVTSSALTGFHRSDLKSVLSMLSLGVQLGISWVAIRGYGLIGLASAQIAQNFFLMATGWILILMIQPTSERLRFPRHLSVPAFAEMIGFGVRLQVLSVTNLIYDPATKFVLSAVAGPAALGLYETAYRLVFYARALIIAPSQNLTPKFASFGTDRMDLTRQLYQMSSAMFSLFGALGGILLVLASPLISVLLLKHAQPSYTVWVAILSIGWFFNIAAAPAYLMGIGTGQLRWNIIGSAFTALCSLVLGYCLGQIFGGIGVVVAASVAIAGGGIITAAVNCRIAGLDTCLPTMAAYAESVAYLRREVVRALAPAGPRGNGSI